MITIKETISLILAEVESTQKPSSHRTYRHFARSTLKEWGHLALEDITEDLLQAWVNRRSKTAKPSTIRYELCFLSRCFKLAEKTDRRRKSGRVLVSPIPLLTTPKIKNQRTRVISEQEESLFFKNMSNSDFSVFLFAIHTGLRRMEQFSIKVADVEFIETVENGEMVRKGMAFIADSKTGESRYCALNVVAAHVAWVWAKNGHEYLFCGDAKNQNRMKVGNNFEQRWRRIYTKIGLANTGLCWHCTRHTFATRALRAGARIQDVQKMLGHKSITQTERYAHWSSEALWPAADALCKKMVA